MFLTILAVVMSYDFIACVLMVIAIGIWSTVIRKQLRTGHHPRAYTIGVHLMLWCFTIFVIAATPFLVMSYLPGAGK